MQRVVKWTKKARTNLADRFDIRGDVVEEVRLKVEEHLNLGKSERWIAPGKKDPRLVVAISGMRFVCIEKSPGFFLITSVMGSKAFKRLSKSAWVKPGEAGAVSERGKHLRSMPFAALSGLQVKS
jgi:hypothetical protein